MVSFLHQPVLLNQIVDCFSSRSVFSCLDATVGAAGHARALVEHHPEMIRLIAIDRDSQVEAVVKSALPYSFVEWRQGSFLEHFVSLQESERRGFDAIVMDLGVSSMQLDSADRGFSFRFDAPLDMRMDQTEGMTAAEILRRYSERELSDLFYYYGEERKSRLAAKRIVEARKRVPIKTTNQLVEILDPIFPRRGRIHPATRIFQALRIAVNDELTLLKKALPLALSLLAPQGQLAVISFHSLEDRIVKQAFKAADRDCFAIITKKPIVPSREEQRKNRRCRSAKLRVIMRKYTQKN